MELLLIMSARMALGSSIVAAACSVMVGELMGLLLMKKGRRSATVAVEVR